MALFDFRSAAGLPSVEAGPAETGGMLSDLVAVAADTAAAGVGSEVMRSMSVVPAESWPDAMAEIEQEPGVYGLQRPLWTGVESVRDLLSE